MKVGIIGTGPMGLALAGALRRAEVPVRTRSSGRHQPAPRRADLDELLTWATVIVPAVPYPVALSLASGPLNGCGDGRTLIDVTNPAMGSGAPAPPGRSGGERLAEASIGWRVAKAFNTVSAAVLDQAPHHGRRTSLLVASDHETALRDTFHIARSLGLQPLHAGGIDTSRHLESLAVLLRRISVSHHCTGRVTISIDTARELDPELTPR